MRKIIGCTLLIALFAAAGGYAWWTTQRDVGHYLSDLRIELAINEGVNNDRGNLLGIEPDLSPRDYQSLALVHLKLAAYLNSARDAGLINGKTVVVLPEHIGSWLMFRGEKSSCIKPPTSIKRCTGWPSATRWPLPMHGCALTAKAGSTMLICA